MTTVSTPTPTRFSGLAVASLVLGIIGVVFSLVPFLNIITMIGAIIGGIMGAVALFGTRKVMAGFGVGLTILAIIITVSWMNHLSNALNGTSALTAPSTAPAAVQPSVEAPAPASGPVNGFGDGVYVVGSDIQPGTYKTAGPTQSMVPLCIWQRLKDTSGSFDAIIANDMVKGPATVTISKSDGAFKSSGCAAWTKVR